MVTEFFYLMPRKEIQDIQCIKNFKCTRHAHELTRPFTTNLLGRFLIPIKVLRLLGISLNASGAEIRDHRMGPDCVSSPKIQLTGQQGKSQVY